MRVGVLSFADAGIIVRGRGIEAVWVALQRRKGLFPCSVHCFLIGGARSSLLELSLGFCRTERGAIARQCVGRREGSVSSHVAVVLGSRRRVSGVSCKIQCYISHNGSWGTILLKRVASMVLGMGRETMHGPGDNTAPHLWSIGRVEFTEFTVTRPPDT